MIAESIIGAAKELGSFRVPIVVRLQGTNSEEGLKLVSGEPGQYIRSIMLILVIRSRNLDWDCIQRPNLEKQQRKQSSWRRRVRTRLGSVLDTMQAIYSVMVPLEPIFPKES